MSDPKNRVDIIILCENNFNVSKALSESICSYRPSGSLQNLHKWLNDRITRDQLVLNLEARMDCEVDNVVYGMDPKTVLVSFKQKPGTVYLKHFLTKADPGLWAGGTFVCVRTEIEDYISL